MQNKNSSEPKTTFPKTTFSIEEDSEYVFKLCRIIAKSICVWPVSSESSVHKIIKFIANLTFILLTTFGFVNYLLQTILVQMEFEEVMFAIGFINLAVGGGLKFIILCIREKNLETCIKYVEEDWVENFGNLEKREIMMKNAKIVHYLTVASVSFAYGGAILFFVIKPISDGITVVTKMNVTVRVFPAPTYGNYATYSPAFEILYTIQLIIQIIYFSTNATSFNLFSLFAIHACGQFELIVFELNTFLIDIQKEQEKMNEKLNLIFKHHLRTLKFICHLKKFISEICFVEVITCMFEICLLGYFIMMILDHIDYNLMVPLWLFLTSYTFNIFIYCFIGEMLTTKATSVGECAYAIEWYTLPKTVNLNFIHLIRASQFPSQITAGKFFVLSLNTFNTIIRSAGVYFNYLWKMTQ